MCGGGAAPADGDEGDAALVDTSEFGIVGGACNRSRANAGVASEVTPIFDEAEDLGERIATEKIGVCAA